MEERPIFSNVEGFANLQAYLATRAAQADESGSSDASAEEQAAPSDVSALTWRRGHLSRNARFTRNVGIYDWNVGSSSVDIRRVGQTHVDKHDLADDEGYALARGHSDVNPMSKEDRLDRSKQAGALDSCPGLEHSPFEVAMLDEINRVASTTKEDRLGRSKQAGALDSCLGLEPSLFEAVMVDEISRGASTTSQLHTSSSRDGEGTSDNNRYPLANSGQVQEDQSFIGGNDEHMFNRFRQLTPISRRRRSSHTTSVPGELSYLRNPAAKDAISNDYHLQLPSPRHCPHPPEASVLTLSTSCDARSRVAPMSLPPSPISTRRDASGRVAPMSMPSSPATSPPFLERANRSGSRSSQSSSQSDSQCASRTTSRCSSQASTPSSSFRTIRCGKSNELELRKCD